MTNGDSPNTTFYMQVYDDQQMATLAIAQLRRVYPSTRVIVRSDGGGRHIFDFGIEFFDEQRLFTAEFGGLAVHRMLELWAEAPTQYLFKIDPDTCVLRRLTRMPDRVGVFGSVQFFGRAKSIQGGCIGMTKDAAQEILSSKLLADGRLSTLSGIPQRFARVLRMRRKKCGLASFDWSIAWACHELRIPMYGHDEVLSRWTRQRCEHRGEHAIVHPWTWISS